MKAIRPSIAAIGVLTALASAQQEQLCDAVAAAVASDSWQAEFAQLGLASAPVGDVVDAMLAQATSGRVNLPPREAPADAFERQVAALEAGGDHDGGGVRVDGLDAAQRRRLAKALISSALRVPAPPWAEMDGNMRARDVADARAIGSLGFAASLGPDEHAAVVALAAASPDVAVTLRVLAALGYRARMHIEFEQPMDAGSAAKTAPILASLLDHADPMVAERAAALSSLVAPAAPGSPSAAAVVERALAILAKDAASLSAQAVGFMGCGTGPLRRAPPAPGCSVRGARDEWPMRARHSRAGTPGPWRDLPPRCSLPSCDRSACRGKHAGRPPASSPPQRAEHGAASAGRALLPTLERRRESQQRPAQQLPRRLDRDAQLSRDLLVRQVGDLRERDDLSVWFGQRRERGLDRRLLFSRRQLARRRRERRVDVEQRALFGVAGRRRRRPQPIRVALVGRPVAVLGDDLAQCSGEQPTAERCLALVLDAVLGDQHLPADGLHEIGHRFHRRNALAEAQAHESAQRRKVLLQSPFDVGHAAHDTPREPGCVHTRVGSFRRAT